MRRTSWRATTSVTAAVSAATSSVPLNRSATGMLFTAVPLSNRFKNHIRCCANDNGIRSGRTIAVNAARAPEPTSDSTRAANNSTDDASLLVHYGYSLATVEGDPLGRKITYPEDIEAFERRMAT